MNTNTFFLAHASTVLQRSLAVLLNLVAIDPGDIAASVLDENPFVSF